MLKQSSYAASEQKELREGVTYQSSVALDVIDDSATQSIPSMQSPPDFEKIPVIELENSTLVAFDLETTLLSDSCEIIQIAATVFDSSTSFDRYILPVGAISPGASKVTGITKKNNCLFLRSRPVESADILTVLKQFSEWLSTLGDNVVLVGHNVNKFDSKHFWRVIESHKVASHFTLSGFIDTLPLFRCLQPTEKSHKQEAVYIRTVGGKYNAHNAMGDVLALVAILIKLGNPPATYYHDYSFTANYVSKRHTHLEMRRRNISTLQPLIQNKVISDSMGQKIAASGLNLSHMKLAFERRGNDGIKYLFAEKFNDKRRVTADKKITSKVCEYFGSNN